jgi:hypothetical protein
MNLNSVVSGAIGTVNPRMTVVLQISTGYTTNPDGTRAPGYAAPVQLIGQWQPIAYQDIQMISGLNIQGDRRKIWLNGETDGLVREDNKGGDLITDPMGRTWLVALVTEQWEENTAAPNWASAIVTRQNSGA